MKTYKFSKDTTIESLQKDKKQIINLMEKEDKIVLDFSRIDTFCFICLGMLVGLYKISLKFNTTLKVKNLSKKKIR